jgi:hypothetical protein
VHVHPIEHLRYVARARGADAGSLVADAASALGSLRSDRAELVVACRRIVERHPEVGPLWWMCAQLLTAADPGRLAWELADEIGDDATPRTLAAALPDEATIVTIGAPPVAAAALVRRGDVRVLCADSRHEASSLLRRLERHDVECEPVPSEALARACAAADVVLVEALAAARHRVLATIGAHVLAATARSVDTPVWLVAGIGTRLPAEYVDAICERLLAGTTPADWDLDVDDLPVGLVDRVVSVDGVADPAAALGPTCPLAPELLRASPF